MYRKGTHGSCKTMAMCIQIFKIEFQAHGTHHFKLLADLIVIWGDNMANRLRVATIRKYSLYIVLHGGEGYVFRKYSLYSITRGRGVRVP